MTHYIVELVDGQEMDVTADQVTVPSGALVFVDDGLTNLVVAPRVWRSVHLASSRPLSNPPAKPAREMPVPPPTPDPVPRRW